MKLPEDFKNRTETVVTRIRHACSKCGRTPEEVTLMAVTKTHPVQAAQWALGAGLRHLGENRVQELATKEPQLADAAAFWELIGPLQSNKARLAVAHASRIQTVDRIKLVNVLDRICGELGKERYPILLQVNVGKDPAKHGCEAGQAAFLVDAIQESVHLQLDGLMTIGELTDDESRIRGTFSRLRELRERLSVSSGLRLPVLSMGMTDDLEWAIEEGSTLIRVGTALFGARGT
jgi:pyridoxal phosphate enzyme (YggS family)